ncbi:MAG TPA: hypothetical protein VFI11_13225 [Anaerolineales bacterium]|nr:hypothetical protein [Anaerolineales bacterium]
MDPLRKILSLAVTLAVISACGGLESSESAEAALRDYFAALHEGRYSEAVALYGGEYDPLEADNPDLEPSDRAGLLERWCRQNGGVCLPVQTIVDVAPAERGFTFVVQFANEDGSTFEIGPCCGEEDTGQRTRDFTYTVIPAGDGFVVLELPPYVP